MLWTNFKPKFFFQIIFCCFFFRHYDEEEPEGFQCNDCDSNFETHEELLQHKNNNTAGILHQCDYCLFKSCSSNDLIRHKIETHQNQLLKCDECDYSFFLQSDLKDHKTSNHPNTTKEKEEPKNVTKKPFKKLKFQCENCDCSYDASYNLQLHNKQVNAKQRSSGIHYKCLDCRFRSCTPIGLKQHRFNCEELKANTPKNSQPNQNSQPKKRPKILLPNHSNDPSSSETVPPTKKLKTFAPNEKVTNITQQNKKMKTLNPQKDSSDDDESDQEMAANHEVPPKVTFKCERCSILFDTVEAKNQHMKLGLGKLKQFQCPKCEFRACHYNGAKEHFAKIHLNRSINTNPQEKTE